MYEHMPDDDQSLGSLFTARRMYGHICVVIWRAHVCRMNECTLSFMYMPLLHCNT